MTARKGLLAIFGTTAPKIGPFEPANLSQTLATATCSSPVMPLMTQILGLS